MIGVMLNPDGRLWIDRLGRAFPLSGSVLSAADGERIVRLVAHHVGVEVHAQSPRVSAELPGDGRAVRGLAAAGRGGAGLRDPQASRRDLHARRLCLGRDHVRVAGGRAARRGLGSRGTSWSRAAPAPARRP